MEKINVTEEQIIQARRDYQKQWRLAHPDAVKRYRHNFWEKQAIKLQQEQEQEEGGGNG